VKSEGKLVPSESPRLSDTTSERHVTKQAQRYHDVFKEESESEVTFPKSRTSAADPKSMKNELIRPKKKTSPSTAPRQTNGTNSPTCYHQPNANSSFMENAKHVHRASGKTLRTVSPDAKSRMRSTAPPSGSIVVVEIDNSPTKSDTKLQSASHLLLEQFRKPLPTSKSGRNRTNSLAIREATHSREGRWLRERRKVVFMAQSSASASEGLSEQYESDDDITMDRRRSERRSERSSERQPVAQPKAKKIQRSKIKLDMGTSTGNSSKPITFAFHPADVVAPAKQVKRLLDAKCSHLSSGAPLTFVNEKNDRHLDGKFQFVNSYIHRGNRKAPLAPLDSGCECSRCDANGTTCSCLQMQDKMKPPYIRSPNGVTILNPDFIDDAENPQEIFECNDSCKCSKDCFNRVVQRGRTIPLEIFMTERCGFGIRSPQPIKKGQFIDVYLGELLTTKDVEDYENAINEKTPSFIFSLDFFGGSPTYHIQGLHFGSPTRFINHSCNPNSRTFTVMMNHADQRVYKLAYFATNDIPAMKEITFDYCPVLFQETPWAPTGDEDDEDVVECFCGESNCRGRVWPKRAGKRKGRGRTKF
jgi:[histone H3]-lysine9 N-trimethyltransferase SUV39H